MFEEDKHGNLLFKPITQAPNVTDEGPEAGDAEIEALMEAAVSADVTQAASDAEVDPPAAAPEPAGTEAKTLRDMLYDKEPWRDAAHPSAGIRRLQERRVNRTLNVVADWMLSIVEQHAADDMTLVLLLELAEAVRNQVTWPERDAAAATDFTRLEPQ